MKAPVFVAILALTAASAAAQITDPTCAGVLYGVASNTQNMPVPGIRLMLWPIGVDLGYVLPRTKTGAVGEYSFENVCTGRFTVVVDDEGAGYPDSIWSYLLGFKREAELTPKDSRIDLPVLVPPKAASLNVVAQDSRTNAPIRILEVKFRTSQADIHDWITFNHNTVDPLLVPSNTDLLLRVAAGGYRDWKGGGKQGKQMRLAPEDHAILEVELQPLR